MEIAKHITGGQFLRLDLSVAGKDWTKAILMLRQRVTERFIEPTDKLIELEKSIPARDKKYGFAILALDCLLCETIQSFYEGIENSTGKSKTNFCKIPVGTPKLQVTLYNRYRGRRFLYKFQM